MFKSLNVLNGAFNTNILKHFGKYIYKIDIFRFYTILPIVRY